MDGRFLRILRVWPSNLDSVLGGHFKPGDDKTRQYFLQTCFHFFSCAAAAAAAAAARQNIPGFLSCPIHFDGAIRTHKCKRDKHTNKIRKRKWLNSFASTKPKNSKYIKKLGSGASNTPKLLRWSRVDAGTQGLVLSSWWESGCV